LGFGLGWPEALGADFPRRYVLPSGLRAWPCASIRMLSF
jgi:hypothetical protein